MFRTLGLDYSRSEIEHVITEWVKNDTHKRILKRRYLHGDTIEMIAERFNFSTSSIKRIIKEYHPVLLGHLQNKN